MKSQFANSRPAAVADATTLPPVVSQPETRDWFTAVEGERLNIRIHSSEVDGKFAIVESVAAPMTATPMHTHREDEVFQIVEGVLTLACNGRIFDAPPGATVVVPAGAHHAWRNRGATPVRMLVTFLPGGVEDLLSGLQHVRPEEYGAFAATFGTEIVGPPIPA